MKKSIFFTIVSLLVMMTSCLPKHAVYVGLLDYRPAAELYGVQMTESDAVNFDYEPIGSLIVIEQSGQVEVKKISVNNDYTPKKQVDDDLYGSPSSTSKKSYANATSESIIKYMAQAAKDAGGDYVLNLNIQRDPTSKKGYTLIATGMVVKRK